MVLKRLLETGVSINFEKSKFAVESVKYLGHEITSMGIKPEISKVEAFELKPIKTKRNLERLLGFKNWFTPFIPKLSIITTTLYEKLKKENRCVCLTDNDMEKIRKIFQIIKKQPVLHYPDFNKSFNLYCDASDNGIGSILLQNNKLIGYSSKKYTKQEENYSVIEKEVLAILRSLQHFKQIIFNSKIHIFTDNANILFQGGISRRINRWKLIMEEFDYEKHHIKGKNNTHADFLSRAFKINSEITKNIQLELKELDYNKAIQILNETSKSHQLNFLKEIHEYLFHPGVNKMYETLRRYIKLKSLKGTLYELIKNCKKCQEEKNYKTVSGHITNNYDINEINQTVQVDPKGPIPSKHYKCLRDKTNDQFYLFIMTDLFSRFTESRILWSITSKQICNAFEENWLKKHGTPKNCISDNGRQFISKRFGMFLISKNINHIKTATYNPTGNSIVERINQEVGTVLRILREKSIKEIPKGIDRRINYNANMTTGYPPKEIFLSVSIFNNYEKPVKIDKNVIKQRIISKMNQYIEKFKSKKGLIKYKTGDKIYVKNMSLDKVEKKWLGPYTIAKISKNPNNVYIKKRDIISKISIRNTRPFSRERI
ncbi:Transposon Tf2-9 polyprotein [Dictyocoela muelleri]|nr:Transposon Tf2-9 polyprotein [Dictyocoela muelleri]